MGSQLGEGRGLRNLTIFQEVPGADPGSVLFVYENRYPQYAVDAVRMKYVADAVVEGVRVQMAGSTSSAASSASM